MIKTGIGAMHLLRGGHILKVKKRISLVIALMMLMTVFAVPMLAYGKENKVKATPRSEGSGFYITNNSAGEGDIDDLYMDLNDSVQLYLFEMSSPITTLPSGWSWNSADTETITITSDGIINAVSRGYASITVTDDEGNILAALRVYCGYNESSGYVVKSAEGGSFDNNPYVDEYESLYTTLGTSSGNNTMKLKVGSDDETTINQTDWTWEVTNDDDNGDQILSLSETNSNGVTATGKQSGIVQVRAFNEIDDYTKVLTIYVGDAYDWYLVDGADNQEGFVGVNNTLNLYLKTIPENSVIPSDYNVAVEDIDDNPITGVVRIDKNGNKIGVTGLAESESALWIYAYVEKDGDTRWSPSYYLRAGSELLWIDKGSVDCQFTLFTKSKTAKVSSVYAYDDAVKTLTIPSSVTASKDDVYNPGTYTVTSMKSDLLVGEDLNSITIPNTVTSIGAYAVGYDKFENSSGKEIYSKIPNFIIYGYSPTSAAANYAAANGLRYINIGSKPAQTISGASSFTKAYGSKAFNLGASASNGGALTFSSSNTKVAAVSASGVVTIKGTGKATITITAAATDLYGGGSKTVNITVTPKKVAGIKAKAGKKSMTVSWKKDTKASGYQITYAQKKNFKKGKKNVTISKNKTTKRAIKKLKSKKTYYVKVRAYKKAGSQKLYGAYSAVKKVKVK